MPMKHSRRGSKARFERNFSAPSVRENNGQVSYRNGYSSAVNGQSRLTGTFSNSFRVKHSYSCSFSLLSFVGISAFYVSFKYYHAPVHAQLNRNATSILRQMQSKHRDKEPNERHAQERKGCGQRRMPQLRNLRLPNRKRLERLHSINPPTFPLGLQANPANLLTPHPFI